MTYMTVQQAAEAWGVTVRQVQSYCNRGRVPGAQKFGSAWQIPAGTPKPEDARYKAARALQETTARTHRPRHTVGAHLMPLMNTPFRPGECGLVIAAMPEGVQRDIATAEYHYFSGQAEKAAQEAELYLTNPDREARLSACLIYAYANLTLGRIQQARVALVELQATLTKGEKAKQPNRCSVFCWGCSGGPSASASAGGAASGPGIPAPAAAWAAGLCPVCAGPLPISAGRIPTEYRDRGGHPGHGGRGAIPSRPSICIWWRSWTT